MEQNGSKENKKKLENLHLFDDKVEKLMWSEDFVSVSWKKFVINSLSFGLSSDKKKCCLKSSRKLLKISLQFSDSDIDFKTSDNNRKNKTM